MPFFQGHPYLLTTLLLLGPAALAVALLPRQRKMLLVSGGLAVPLACFAYQHTPWYWAPQRTTRFVPALEDALFMADWGVIAWSLAVLPLTSRVGTNLRWKRVLLLYVPGLLASLPATELLRHLVFGPVNVMAMHVLLFASFGGYCLWRRPDAWFLGLAGGLLSAAFQLGFFLVFLAYRPSYLDAWNPAAQLPWQICGVPGFELLWAAGFGGCWPLFLAYACDVRLVAGPSNGPAGEERAVPGGVTAVPVEGPAGGRRLVVKS